MSLLFLSLVGMLGVSAELPTADGISRTANPDTAKVLIVFVKFADDHSAGDPTINHREWPLHANPTTLPASARFLLSTSPHPPYVDSTLTAYLHMQSNRNLVLFGDVFPATIVTSAEEARYHRPQGGYADLTYDVLRQLDSAGVDFSDYDYHGDGVVDHIFMVLRRDSEKDAGRISWTGASCLDALCANGPPSGKRRPALTIDGVRIDWNLSGSVIYNRTPGNVNAHYWLVRMMAHEYGHDLWQRHFVHVPALADNDIPARSTYRRATNTLGYTLMAGAGGGNDARGDETVSAFERDLLGWIDCSEIRSTTLGITIRDLYTSSDCVRISTGGGRQSRTLYVSNRQRIGPFDRYRRAGVRAQYEIGLLRTTGLLIGIASGNRYEVIPADNSLELSIHNRAYAGDMFGPGRQLTPWTRPNVNGYNNYPQRAEPMWHAIDNIRTHPADQRVFIFDYLDDFRESPVFRDESWIDAASAGQSLRGKPRVEDATVHVDAELTIDGRLTVDGTAAIEVGPSGRLTVSSGSSLILYGGSRLRVDGVLQIDGVLLPHAQSTIEVSRSGQLIQGHLR